MEEDRGGGRSLTDKHMWRTASLMFSLRVAIHGDLLKALRRPIARTPVYTVFTLQNLRVCLFCSCCYSYFLLAHLLTSWNKTHSRKHEAKICLAPP